jgi:DHA1 family bicyclomycin/chloramphenicol resistance-like MFS transporter
MVRFLDRTTPPHILTLVLVTGMSAMVVNMFLPSLPAMTEHFETEYRIMQLSVALFLAVNAVLQLVVGTISDRFGRRPVLLGGFALFLLATLGCIYAPTVEVFLAFRMAQAAVVVAMVLSRAVVRDMVPQDEAASMIGYVTMGMAIVPMISPAIGGWLDQTFGWQSVFWCLFWAGAVVMALVWIDLGETNSSRSASFGQQFREYPELFMSRRFWGYCLASAFATGSFFAYLGGAPFIGTQYFGMSPTELGIFFGAPALGYMVGNYLSGRFSVSAGVNRMILIGSCITGIGMATSAIIFLLGFGTIYTFFGFMIFVGLGNGMVLPNATSGMLSVRPHLAGTASGLGGAIMIGGGAALSALAGMALSPGSGPMPLLLIMLTVSVLGVISILYVIDREKKVGIV